VSPIAVRDLVVLRAEARYARERYELYKAKAYGQRPTSETRMRELQRVCEGAEGRLRAAEAEERRARAAADGLRRRAESGPSTASDATAIQARGSVLVR
jgi:hypothetical protein